MPLLSAANWGGMGLHPRGNFEGYLRAGSKQKWLEVHGDTHFTLFYAEYGQDAAEDVSTTASSRASTTAGRQQPKVLLNIRHPGEKFVPRAENEWPLARTQWTKFYLDPAGQRLRRAKRRSDATTLAYRDHRRRRHLLDAADDGAAGDHRPGRRKTVRRRPTPPTPTCSWCCACSIRPARRSSFIGSNDPRTPVGLGWLRASHRKLDPALSQPYRPWHTHDEKQPLTPGVPVELDVEIWPTSIVVPPGYRLALSVRGKDYEYDGTDAAPPHAPYPMKGVGPFTHTNPQDRPTSIFGGTNTLHFADGKMPYVLLPVIPENVDSVAPRRRTILCVMAGHIRSKTRRRARMTRPFALAATRRRILDARIRRA